MDQANSETTTPSPKDTPPPPLSSQARGDFLLQRWRLERTGISPEEIFQAIGRLRHEARREIDRLIGFLDKTDDYVARELEDDDDREEGGDTEPSLGSFDRMTNQEKSWRAIGGADLDAEHDTADDEPALGSLDHDHQPNQELWATGDRRDLEQDGAESGIGDHDGLLEQVGMRDWTHTVMG